MRIGVLNKGIVAVLIEHERAARVTVVYGCCRRHLSHVLWKWESDEASFLSHILECVKRVLTGTMLAVVKIACTLTTLKSLPTLANFTAATRVWIVDHHAAVAPPAR